MASSKYFSPASLEERKEGVQLLPPPAPKRNKTSALKRSPSFLLPPPSPPVAIPPPRSIIVPTNGVDLWHHFHRPRLDQPHLEGLPQLQRKIGDTNYSSAACLNAVWDPVLKRYKVPPGDEKRWGVNPPPLEPIPEVEEEEKCHICRRPSTDMTCYQGVWYCEKDKEGCKRTFDALQAEMEAKKTDCVICGKKFGTGKEEEGEVCDHCVCVYRDS